MGTENVDLIDAWRNLYVMLGTSSAALIGLLFVATSIHLGDVVSNPGFRVRSYNQTLYLLTLLVEAVLILVPQPVPFLGAELMVLNLVGLWFPLSTSYTFIYKHRDNSHRRHEDVPCDSIQCGLTPRYSRWHRPDPGLSLGDVHCDCFVHHSPRHGRVGYLVDHARLGTKAIGGRSKGKGRQLTCVRYWPKADMPKNAMYVAIGGKAETPFCAANARFITQSGHRRVHCTCLLLTQSGRSRST